MRSTEFRYDQTNQTQRRHPMRSSKCCPPLLLLVSALSMAAACATLIHRYSFTTDVSDSVRTANGTNLLNTAQHPVANPVVYNGCQAVMDGLGGYIQFAVELGSDIKT